MRVFFRRNIFYFKFFCPVVTVPPPLSEIVATITHSATVIANTVMPQWKQCITGQRNAYFYGTPEYVKCSKQYAAGSYRTLIKYSPHSIPQNITALEKLTVTLIAKPFKQLKGLSCSQNYTPYQFKIHVNIILLCPPFSGNIPIPFSPHLCMLLPGHPF